MMEKELMNVNPTLISLGFNLREPKANKSTQVYAVVRLGNGKHLKFPLGKLNTWEWDAKREIPIFRERMNPKDGANAMNVLQRISAFRLGYYDFYLNLCGVGELRMTSEEIREELKSRTTATHTHFSHSQLDFEDKKPILVMEETNTNEIITDMSKNTEHLEYRGGRVKTATAVIKKAFEDYKRQHTLAKGTIRTYSVALKFFCDYCKEKGDSMKKRLSQAGIEEYQRYLIENGEPNSAINFKCKSIERLVNDGILNKAELGIEFVKFSRLKVEKKNAEEKVRRPLTDAEVRKLETCKGLTPHQRERLDLFLLQIYCGCRNSDLDKFWYEDRHQIDKEDGVKIISFKTQKSKGKNTQHVIVTPKIEAILNRYSGGFQYVKFNVTENAFNKAHNKCLKAIAEKAGLDSIESFTDKWGESQTAPLHEKLAGHFGRYTFVHKKIAEGYTPDEIAPMTGHKNGKEIVNTYGVLDHQEQITQVMRNIKKVQGRRTEQETNTKALGDLKEYQDVLRFFGCPYDDFKDITDSEELVRLIVTRYETPLTTQFECTYREIKEAYNNRDWAEQDRMLKLLDRLNEEAKKH